MHGIQIYSINCSTIFLGSTKGLNVLLILIILNKFYKFHYDETSISTNFKLKVHINYRF